MRFGVLRPAFCSRADHAAQLRSKNKMHPMKYNKKGNRMRYRDILAGLIVLATLASTASARAQQVYDPPEPTESGLYFVQFAGAPTADGASAATVQQQQDNFRAAAASAGVSYSERFAFQTLWNGLSVATANPAALARVPGVKAVLPVRTIESVPGPVSPNLFSALPMTRSDFVQTSLGYTGQGMKIGIIDTGVDYTHPDLGGCFGPQCKVAGGWAFVDRNYNGTNAYTPGPDPFDDCNGHGTHVSGIAAGAGQPVVDPVTGTISGGIRGVAPDARIYAYKVFGCTGTVSTDIIVAAMERALADRVDVINMSLGSSRGWPNSPENEAAARLVRAGITVVASAGNSQADGAFVSGMPGIGRDVIGVASLDNTRSTKTAINVPGVGMVGYGPASGAPLAPKSGVYPLVRTGTNTTTNDACSGLPAGSLSGQIALIRRGGCAFATKAGNAQNAGAAGVVLYNNANGDLTPTVASGGITIPVVMVTKADGLAIDARVATGGASLEWTSILVQKTVTTGGYVSSFSSMGPAADLTMKPDVAAPGGLIYSTYPRAMGSYATLSGTSMASPHTAGAATLVLQAYRARGVPISAYQVRDILQSTARPSPATSDPNALEAVTLQGAGLIDVAAAVQATTFLSPAKLSLGEIESGSVTRTITLSNISGNPVTYDILHQPALASTGTYFSGAMNLLSFSNAPAVVGSSAASVTVPGGGSASVNVTITPDAGLAAKSVFDGYILFRAQGGGQDYRVPYLGFKGDYQSIQVLPPASFAVGRLNASEVCKPIAAPYVFSMALGDRFCFIAHIDHQASRVQLNVRSADNSVVVGKAFDWNYVPRNQTSTATYAQSWDGFALRSSGWFAVPNGAYTLQVQVLKPLGNPNNPAHLETFSVPITIAR